MSTASLAGLARARATSRPSGVTSICSAHPLVIEAALREAAESGTEALIEATCNQVNQDGGYTGHTPASFRDLVHAIAHDVGLPAARIVLGGDHLGPSPWRHLPATQAMDKAARMIEAYAAAGYEKLHLDCSMGCAGETAALDDSVTAERAAGLAARAEAATTTAPVYVIGTEVPTPGGATDRLDHLEPTRPDAVRTTHRVHEAAFADVAGIAAWRRVLAMVVQPGVEFSDAEVAVYRPERAAALAATLDCLPGLVFEAHSTDYQPPQALARLVRDGFAILKVGPGLTYALREALYGLDAIASVLHPGRSSLADTMEATMLADPVHWRSHYRGTPAEQRVLRHYAYSDRIRYYWSTPDAGAAVDDLLRLIGNKQLPATLISQHLQRLSSRVASGAIPATGPALLIEAVRDVVRGYERACRPFSPHSEEQPS